MPAAAVAQAPGFAAGSPAAGSSWPRRGPPRPAACSGSPDREHQACRPPCSPAAVRGVRPRRRRHRGLDGQDRRRGELLRQVLPRGWPPSTPTPAAKDCTCWSRCGATSAWCVTAQVTIALLAYRPRRAQGADSARAAGWLAATRDAAACPCRNLSVAPKNVARTLDVLSSRNARPTVFANPRTCSGWRPGGQCLDLAWVPAWLPSGSRWRTSTPLRRPEQPARTPAACELHIWC